MLRAASASMPSLSPGRASGWTAGGVGASVYSAADVAAIDFPAAVGEPGGYPFTRGIYREMY